MAGFQDHEITTPEKVKEVAAIMVPFPSQSHLNQLLELAALISSCGLPVHFVGSATHNRQVKLRASGLKPEAVAKIHFHDFPTPPISLPDPGIRNPLDNAPVDHEAAAMSYLNFRSPIAALAQKLSTETRRTIIICDRLMAPAVQEAVSVPNTEYYAFHNHSAVGLFCTRWEGMGKPFQVEADIYHLPSVKEFLSEMFIYFLAFNLPEHYKGRAGDIYNTIRSMEGRFVDLLQREEISGDKRQFAIRSNLQVKFSTADDGTKTRHKCLEWLDRQAPRSVIYVSFGSTSTLSDQEARELAIGLEQSKQKFIWVLRGADKADIFSGGDTRIELPVGFEERVQENGIVMRDWAPQLEILAHRSTGGFMTHCGWNSVVESLSLGVPIAAWPMHSEQPLNAVYLTEILKVGLIVREWSRRDEVVQDSVIRNIVVRLMASEEGDEIRKRAEELSAAINKSTEDGGGYCKDLDNFIAHITR